tara:strand:- start:90393 stop:90683 length:291 start_codon:yes stop_codon:yes gene_type:complete
MGWSYGHNLAGREIGYGVEAICDHPGCKEEIDRGLAYACGGEHDNTELSCDKYFCGKHLSISVLDSDSNPGFICGQCAKELLDQHWVECENEGAFN